MSWTPERIDELTKLWESGHSASAIGKMLGVSKNAVVGKAHRMKLQARPSPIKRGEEGGTSNSAASARTSARQKSASAKTARSGSAIAAAGKSAVKNEPLQTVISAALAAKSAGSGTKKETTAADRGKGAASGARSAAQAATATKTARSTPRGSVASAARAVNASRRGPKCLWPIGDPGDPDFHFCGAPALAGKPYCAEHCAKAYITRSRSDSAAA